MIDDVQCKQYNYKYFTLICFISAIRTASVNINPSTMYSPAFVIRGERLAVYITVFQHDGVQ